MAIDEKSAAVEADRVDAAETEELRQEAEAENNQGYIEFLGEEPHGTAFLTTHTLPRGDGLWKRNKLTVNKDIVWERDPMGPAIGQPGSRMLVPISDLPDGTLEILEKTPGYKRVNE